MLSSTQLAAKRHNRTMAQREKRRARLRSQAIEQENLSRHRAAQGAWLADLGKKHQDAARTLEAAHRQALESRRTKVAMPSHPPQGFFGRVKAFFRRTP